MNKYNILEENNKKINDDYNKLKEEYDKNKSNIQITKNIIINQGKEGDNNNPNIEKIEIITEKVITEEIDDPIIIKKHEVKPPSKFKQSLTLNKESNKIDDDKKITDSDKINENKNNINENTNDNNKINDNIKDNKIENEKDNTVTPKEESKDKDNNKNDFMSKIKMFSQTSEAGNLDKKAKEAKKVLIIEKKVEFSKKEENDKLKQQKMSKALQRIKKKKEKTEESSTSAQHDLNDPRFKSIRIKNMAELLEGHMNQNQQSGEINEDNTNNTNNENNDKVEEDSKKEESSLIDDILDGKVLTKRKKTKKKFDEE